MVRSIRSTAVVAGAALLLVLTFTAGLLAQGDGPGRHGRFGDGPGPRGFLGLGALDLSDAQREQVRAVMERYKGQMGETGKRLHEAHDAQQAAVEAVPVNESLIRSTTQALANAETDMALLRARIHNDVWSLLTPDQQEKAKELKAQREARMKERFQRRQQRQQQQPQKQQG